MDHSAHAREHHLHLDAATRLEARRRLASVRGHVEGIQKMLDDEGVYCVDALKQLKAVQGALDRVAELILRSHLEHHVASARERGDTQQLVNELMEVLKYR